VRWERGLLPWDRVISSAAASATFRRWYRRDFRNYSENLAKDLSEICQHSLIPYSYHAVPGHDEKCFALCVMRLLVIVDLAIDFDDEMAFRAAEIHHKWSDRKMPTELEPIKAAVSQCLPQHGLS
jgi:hypothetical protein